MVAFVPKNSGDVGARARALTLARVEDDGRAGFPRDRPMRGRQGLKKLFDPVPCCGTRLRDAEQPGTKDQCNDGDIQQTAGAESTATDSLA